MAPSGPFVCSETVSDGLELECEDELFLFVARSCSFLHFSRM